MSSLEGDQAYRNFNIPESAHTTVLRQASNGRPWTPEVADNPGVEIDEEVYAEGVLEADPRHKQDIHDLLLHGRLDRFRKKVEEGKNKWDLALVEQDFYEHPSEFNERDEISHNRDPEKQLRKGDADLLFIDLDRYDVHMVEVKPHDGYAKDSHRKTMQDSRVDQWEEQMQDDLIRSKSDDRELNEFQIYDFASETYPEVSYHEAEEVLNDFYDELGGNVLFSVLTAMSGSEWVNAQDEVQRVAENENTPAEYQTFSPGFQRQRTQNESSEQEGLSRLEKKTKNLSEAWETVVGELENDWTIYHPEFVFGSSVLDTVELSENPEYALPDIYDQETGYVFGSDSGFDKAESSSDLEILNQTFFREEIAELLEGETPEIRRKPAL